MSQIDTINIKYGSIKYLLLILMSIGQYVCVCVWTKWLILCYNLEYSFNKIKEREEK
jgi:hypothetical protein